MAKRRIIWLLVFIAALAAFLFGNNLGTEILLLSAAFLPIFSAFAMLFCKSDVSATITAPDNLNRGDVAECTVTLTGSRLHLSVTSYDVLIENLLTGEMETIKISQSAKSGAAERFEFSSDHYGILNVTVQNIKIFDIFGLFVKKISFSALHSVTVSPERFPVGIKLIDTADFLSDSERYSTSSPGYDPSETFRIREYVPGDPVRRIHWKLSEKSGKTLVRDFGLPIVQDMLILLETASTPAVPLTPTDMDAMLEIFFSLATALIDEEISFAVGWQTSDGELTSFNVAGEDDFEPLTERLLSTTIFNSDSTVVGCYCASHLECAYAHAVVISPKTPWDIEALFHGNRVTALVPDSGDFDNAPDAVIVGSTELHSGSQRLEI
jgi:uncharacterized protein (DUF58 family)